MDTWPLPQQIPTHPLNTAPPPVDGYPSRAQRREWVHHVLRGVPLGAYDGRMVEWLVGCDEPTVLVVASWIERARTAERAAYGAEVVGGLER
jgi:hypothetical protein